MTSPSDGSRLPVISTNSSIQRVNESRDTEESPVTWHRHHGGEARVGHPGNLTRKHDTLVLKWTQWLTSQREKTPASSKTKLPNRPESCPMHTVGSGSHTRRTRRISHPTNRGQMNCPRNRPPTPHRVLLRKG